MSLQSATKTKIMKIAETLFWQDGYVGASINDIVAAAGLSKGGFFYHYENKNAITTQVLENYFAEQILNPLDRHLSRAENAAAIKVALMGWLEETFGAYALKEFRGGCMLGNFALEVADQDEELRDLMKTMFLSWENRLVSSLRTVAAEGKLLMEARQFARLLISMYQGITMTCKVHRDSNRAARDFQALAELIERMIKD